MFKNIILTLTVICCFATFANSQTKKPNNRTKNSLLVLQGDIDLKPYEFTSETYDEPLRIYYKPFPSPIRSCVRGVVRLRITFLGNGIIGKISAVSSLPDGATDNSIEAAKLIKFIPAMKDGKPITISKVVEFKFGIY